jgi:spore germination cell wall hydrolase CwlJ-like protein
MHEARYDKRHGTYRLRDNHSLFNFYADHCRARWRDMVVCWIYAASRPLAGGVAALKGNTVKTLIVLLMASTTAHAGTLADRLGISTVHDKVMQATCLAENIYFEARGETLEGQLAVAQVTINRALAGAPHFPGTICGVVWQGADRRTGCQFSWTCQLPDKILREQDRWEQAQTIAWVILKARDGYLPVGGATHYARTDCKPAWLAKMFRAATIGMHAFYLERVTQ